MITIPRRLRGWMVAVVLVVSAGLLAAIPSTQPTAPAAAVTHPTSVASHADALHNLQALFLLPEFQVPAQARTMQPKPTTAPPRIVAKGSGPSAVLRKHHVPVTVANPSIPGVSWPEKCVTQFHFCIRFPYATGSTGTYQTHDDYSSGTSVTRRLHNYTGGLWVADNAHGYCKTAFTDGCNPTGELDEYFFVEVIGTSKYAPNPIADKNTANQWAALTGINEGVKDPIETTYQGHLACYFKKGIYGGPGMTVWFDNHVYYLETLNLTLTPNDPQVVQTFLHSLRFTLKN